MAKHVELAATSAGAVRQGKRQVQPSTQEVALEVGSAVSAAEAKGPCWDLNNALRESFKRGHTTWVQNPSSNCLVAFCCHPCRGWLGSGSSRPSGGVRDNSCRCQRVFALTNCLEARSSPLLQMPDHQLSNEGVSVPHHTQAVCPTGEMGRSLHPLRTREPRLQTRPTWR